MMAPPIGKRYHWYLAFWLHLLLVAGVVAAAYAGLIPEQGLRLPYYDVVLHFGAIGFSAFLLDVAQGIPRRPITVARWRTFVSPAALWIGGIAAAEETVQLLAPLRTFDWLDLGANLAGAFFFTWVAEFITTERWRYATFGQFLRGALHDLGRFTGKIMLALLFPVAIFTALYVTRWITFPLAGLYRYDFLLLLFLGVQAALVLLGVESPKELKTITLFHLLGLGLELFKVRAGSWSYPEPALTKVGGVPLYSGFMYASVASFLIAVWHRLRLRLVGWPPAPAVALLGSAIYLNFFTHHFVADLRWLLILGVLFLFFRAKVVVVNTDKPRTIPLVASFVGLAVFIWIAENIATFLGAWAYPDQLEGWRLVHFAKINSWFLLGIISFMLVAELKRNRGKS